MSTVTIAEAREHLDELCASVAETGEPVVIEHNGRTVRLVPTEDEKSDPEMIRRLYAALDGDEDDRTITTTVEDLCKAIGIDASKL
jgi:prevent-host-death family protein